MEDISFLHADVVLSSLCALIQLSILILWIPVVINRPINPLKIISSTRSISSPSAASAQSDPSKTDTTNATTTTSIDSNKTITIEKEMYKNSKSNNMKFQSIPKSFKILTTLSLVFGFLSILDNIFITIVQPICLITTSNMIFMGLQRWALWGYYIYRIQITFKDSLFSLSIKKLNCFKLMIPINGTIVLFIYIYYTVVIDNCGENAIIGLIPAAINDAFISILTLVLFVNRLQKLLHLNKDKSNTLTKQNLKLKQIITKLTILLLVTICTTFWLMLFFVFVPLLTTGCMDTVINSMCLLLSFVYFDKYYEKLCCSCIKCAAWMSEKSKQSEKSNLSHV